MQEVPCSNYERIYPYSATYLHKFKSVNLQYWEYIQPIHVLLLLLLLFTAIEYSLGGNSPCTSNK